MQGEAHTFITTTQIGADFGTTEPEVANYTPQNHTIFYQRGLYSVGDDGIYSKDDVTTDLGTWTRVHTFTSPDSTNNRYSGLYAVNISNVASLTMFYGTTTGTSSWRGVTYDGTTWSETAEFTGPSLIITKSEISYRNQVYVVGKSGGGTTSFSWNPTSRTMSSISGPFTNGNVGMCVFQDNLYAVYSTTGYAVTSLAVFAGNWSPVVSNFSTATYASDGSGGLSFDTGNQCLFTDGTNMYCFVSGLHDLDQALLTTAGEGGWRCYQFDSALAVTNLTGAVIPSYMKAATDGGTGGTGTMGGVLGPQGGRFFAFTESGIGVQTTWLLWGPSTSVGFWLFEWKGPATLIDPGSPERLGGLRLYSVPTLPTSGGEYIWDEGDLDVWVTGVSADPTGTLISFKAAGDPGMADKTIVFRVDYDGEPALVAATLIGSATGGSATRSGNSVINVDADGTTTYTVVWDSGTDLPVDKWRAGLIPNIS
jgi:hypothetical protein